MEAKDPFEIVNAVGLDILRTHHQRVFNILQDRIGHRGGHKVKPDVRWQHPPELTQVSVLWAKFLSPLAYAMRLVDRNIE